MIEREIKVYMDEKKDINEGYEVFDV